MVSVLDYWSNHSCITYLATKITVKPVLRGHLFYKDSFSLVCLFSFPFVFSNIYLSCVMCTLCCQFLWIVLLYGQINAREYRRVIQKDNREKLATLGTQDTGQINVREYRRGNTKGQSR
jgi:FlaA1/EpsC-like NDP-sugar epimerase